MKTLILLAALMLSITAAAQTTKHESARRLTVELAGATKGFPNFEVWENGQVSLYLSINPATELHSAQKMVNRYLRTSDFTVVKRWSTHKSNAEVIHVMDKHKQVFLIAYIQEQSGQKYLAVMYSNEKYIATYNQYNDEF